MVNYKHITIFDDTNRKNKNTSDLSMMSNKSQSSVNNSFSIERNDYLLPSSQIDKFNIDSYVNTNPNRTMFKLHAVPIDIDENCNNLKSINNNRSSYVLASSSNRAQSLNRSYNSNLSSSYEKKERAKSPTMLVDLVINTPKSDIKIQRKCKSYEVS